MYMASTNRYRGLARGPIDHKSSSVINQISGQSIVMGSSVILETTTIPSGELLPRVKTINVIGSKLYGIAVGGDADGVYGDGSTGDDSNLAATGAGQGVVVVTQGRCLARVSGKDGGGAVVIGDALTQEGFSGLLRKAIVGEHVIAIALNSVSVIDLDMIAVDVQREGFQT